MLKNTTWTAGDTVTWTTTLSDYPFGNGWVLTAHVLGDTPLSASGTSDTDGVGHVITFSAADTAGLVSGSYKVIETISKGSERFTLYATAIEVLADPTKLGAGYDPRSHVKRVLDSIKAVIEGRATKAEESVSIAGRSLARTPLSDLLVLYNQYQQLVRSEQETEKLAKGMATGAKILVRFTE
jgi:hypothetical protein